MNGNLERMRVEIITFIHLLGNRQRLYIMYESQVTFVMDVICPWTYIAKKRLDKALSEFTSSSISFTLRFDPYQPSPDLDATIPSRSEYALHHKHNDNPAAQEVFEKHMLSLASPLSIPLVFDGPTGNSLAAHRVIQVIQETTDEITTNKLVDNVFNLYFAEGLHPGDDETLIRACVEAGVDEEMARDVVGDKERGERDVKLKMRSIGMDVDAVPVVIIEGRRRDLTLTGLKEVDAYVKALETIAKEST